MAFYIKNIGGAQQIARAALGLAAAAIAFVLLAPPVAYVAAGAGLALAATGFVGYCPICAATGFGGKG